MIHWEDHEKSTSYLRHQSLFATPNSTPILFCLVLSLFAFLSSATFLVQAGI